MFKATLAASLTAVALAGNVHDRSYYEQKFYDWLSTHKIAAKSGEHFVHMLQNFANNDDLIESHNAKGLSYTLGHNAFSGMSLDEFRAYVRLGLDRPSNIAQAANVHQAPADMSTIASSKDWVADGGVTDVKDQGQCGSCWSFSSTGAMEGAYFVKNGKLESMSEQNFVDCDTLKNGGRDHGCNGGLMDNAFAWATKNGGICSEADYPYTSGSGKEGSCSDSRCKNSAFAPKSFTDVKANSDDAMMSALNQQPVAIAIEADQAAFQLYKSGVFTGECGTNLDHGVLAVGYGTQSGNDFYKVKNSWGPSWGQDGYILLGRGSSYNKGQGQCGMLIEPSYPNF